MNLRKIVFVLSMLLVLPLAAAENRVQFSADSVMSAPQQGSQQGKMYVGNGKFRVDMTINDNLLIQIMDTRSQTAYMINTAEKSYTHHQAAGASMQAVTGSQPDPCAALPNATCKKVGEETLGNRKAEKWEISSPVFGEDEPVVFWTDKEHKFPVRQVMPDGSTLEMTFVGVEKLNGRKAEKWKMTASRPGSAEQVSWRWYDPEINMVVKEERPGGMLREIKNIRIAPQPDSLFRVPDGYQEVQGPPMDGSTGGMP